MKTIKTTNEQVNIEIVKAMVKKQLIEKLAAKTIKGCHPVKTQ